MVVLHCTCPQHHRLWGELWWGTPQWRWVFFDDDKRSPTYGEDVSHCPSCRRVLTRKVLDGKPQDRGSIKSEGESRTCPLRSLLRRYAQQAPGWPLSPARPLQASQ